MKHQFGRSMTEMLGVLALIGMLSIGGLYALNIALTRNKVNNLIEDVRLAGFIVSNERFNSLPEEELPLSLNFTPTYPFTAFKESEVTFAIVANEVTERVCQETIKRKVNWLEEIRPNGMDNACKEGGENTISFFFNTELSTQEIEFFGSCETDADCGECGTCNDRKCVYEVGPVLLKNGTCKACPTTGTVSNTTEDECNRCQNTFWQANHGYCEGCEMKEGTGYVYKESCLNCPNRYWVGKGAEKGMCGYCPEGGTLNTERDRCDYNCGYGNILHANTGKCESCSDSVQFSSTQAQCDKCPNNTRFWDWNYLICRRCDLKDSSGYVSRDECLRCDNRYWFNNNDGRTTEQGVCAYCPAGGNMNSQRTWCDYCTENTLLSGNTGKCVPCADSSTFSTPKEECNKCSDRFWQYNYTRCYSCDVQEDISYTHKEDCLHCKNRYFSENKCKLCPSGQHATSDGLGCE